jgi:hypothetical protein
MKNIIYIIVLLLAVSCSKEATIKGKFIAQDDSSLVKTITFDGEVAKLGGGMFNLFPAFNYKIKNGNIYVDSEYGIIVYKIIDNKTIKGITSIYDGIYVKQK